MTRRVIFGAAALFGISLHASAQGFIDGPKLLTAALGPSNQGTSVALSADGATALVGGPSENTGYGAAWVYTRTSGRWSRQGKLVGSDPIGKSSFGVSVALSSDGNTALVGGVGENGNQGAAWVFTRAGGIWTVGPKLVPTDASAQAAVGTAVALSADGLTALIGGPNDVQSGVQVGAAWIYTRSGSVWTQKTKLIGSVHGVGVAGSQGSSVALSADGTTALVGGPSALAGDGSVWVFVLSSGSWVFQQRLIASSADETGAGELGGAVAIASDGSTAIVGGGADASGAGAAWVWVRTSGSWSIQGSKLVGAGAVGLAGFGGSVAMSGDGNTVIVGGANDDSQVGAAWAFTRAGATWSPQGAKFVGDAVLGISAFGHSAALSSDGRTAMIGAPFETSNLGGAWAYERACPGPAGDVNGNGALDVSDVFYLINFLFVGGNAPVCR